MRKLSRWIPVLGGAIAGGIIALVIANSSGHTTKSVTSTTVVQPASQSEPTAFSNSTTGKSINQIYKQTSPGVVDIRVTEKSSGNSLGGLFGQGNGNGNGGQESMAEGTGVVYDTKGDILTDEHVVAGATSVKVNFNDGKTVSAKVVGTDPSTDVAVIKVDVPSSELHPLKLADSSTAQVGDPVVAIGSPFSQPETVTSGIVSQTGRSIQAPNGFSIAGSIQTDAAINPGNSGGPLLNADAEVLGLNDQIETGNQNAEGEGSSSGIGFATPANTDKKVADEIIAGKKVEHPYIGAELAPTSGTGAQIACVQPGSPGARAGLQVNDVITKVNDTPITSTDQFISTLDSKYDPGQSVTLTVKRQGQEKQIKATLGTRPAKAASCG